MRDLLEAIQELDSHPPCFAAAAERRNAFRKIGRFLTEQTRQNRKYDLNKPDCPVWQPIAERLERALQNAREKELGRDEVHLWQMYNHGVLVKSDEITMGFDLIAMPRRFGWPEPESLRRLMAQVVDVLFVTHRHPDHFDRALVADCLRLGRPVFLPKPMADEYGYDPNLYPADAGDRFELYDLNIIARRGIHVWRDSADEVPLVAYEIVCQSGYRFVFAGDIDYTAPVEGPAWRESPDLFLVPWRSPNARYEPGHPEAKGTPADALQILMNTVRPGMLLFEHYGEMEHVYDGFDPSFDLAFSLQDQLDIPSDILFWGESVPLQPSPFAVRAK